MVIRSQRLRRNNSNSGLFRVDGLQLLTRNLLPMTSTACRFPAPLDIRSEFFSELHIISSIEMVECSRRFFNPPLSGLKLCNRGSQRDGQMAI